MFLLIFLAIAEISFCDPWNGKEYNTNSPEQRYAAGAIIAQLSLQGNERVLDVGCGDGYNTSLLMAKVPHGSVLGVDCSPSMIAFASSNYESKQLAFALMGANQMNFEGEFGLAVSFSTFHWIKDAQDAMQRIYCGLKPNGRMLLEIPFKAVDTVHPLHQAAKEVMRRAEWQEVFRGFNPDWYFRTREEYETMLQGTSFTKVSMESYVVHNHFASEELFYQYVKQWFPYVKHVPEDLRDKYWDDMFTRYVELAPIEPQGIPFHVYRILIEASK